MSNTNAKSNLSKQLDLNNTHAITHGIGMNTTGNKFYHVKRLIGLDKLNLSFIHYKKLMTIQFLKYGKT